MGDIRARDRVVRFRACDEEIEKLQELSKRMGRTWSGTLRYLVVLHHETLQIIDDKKGLDNKEKR
ncbi:MAG: hypothetical protein PVF83_12435 [Anaerolineales bacterium]|jgi:hypothetical protein